MALVINIGHGGRKIKFTANWQSVINSNLLCTGVLLMIRFQSMCLLKHNICYASTQT